MNQKSDARFRSAVRQKVQKGRKMYKSLQLVHNVVKYCGLYVIVRFFTVYNVRAPRLPQRALQFKHSI